jgi:hypothetical protein
LMLQSGRRTHRCTNRKESRETAGKQFEKAKQRLKAVKARIAEEKRREKR